MSSISMILQKQVTTNDSFNFNLILHIDSRNTYQFYHNLVNSVETKENLEMPPKTEAFENAIDADYQSEIGALDDDLDASGSDFEDSERKEKEDPFAANLIEPGTITFSLPAGVLFNKFQCSRDLTLYNKGSKMVTLTLQTFPANLFVARPSCFNLSPNSSRTVILEYSCKPWERTMGRDINGFLRVRSMSGIVLER